MQHVQGQGNGRRMPWQAVQQWQEANAANGSQQRKRKQPQFTHVTLNEVDLSSIHDSQIPDGPEYW